MKTTDSIQPDDDFFMHIAVFRDGKRTTLCLPLFFVTYLSKHFRDYGKALDRIKELYKLFFANDCVMNGRKYLKKEASTAIQDYLMYNELSSFHIQPRHLQKD